MQLFLTFSVNGLGFFGCGFLLCSGGVSLFHRFGIKFRGGHGGLGVVHGLFLGQHEFGVHIAIFVEKEGLKNEFILHVFTIFSHDALTGFHLRLKIDDRANKT